MKKIIFIHLLDDYSGSPKVLSQVIRAAQQNKIEIELYTGDSGNGFLSGITDRHHYFKYKYFSNKYLKLLSFLLSQFILFIKLLKYRNEDALFFINTMLPFGAAISARLMGKQVIYHIHETYLKPELFKKFLRYIIKMSADKVIFVSQILKEKEMFCNKEQLVIHNALLASFYAEASLCSYQQKSDGKFNVLMICSLKQYKGINEFIKIAALCSKEPDIKFTLVLNANQQSIDDFFQSIKLTANVQLVSRQENVISFYKTTSLLLNLSLVDHCIESFGLTIIEAMAFAIPVIVPPVGGPTELITHGLEGFLISSYETEKIADTIFELFHNEVLCLKLSCAAKTRVGNFTEDIFIGKISELLTG